MSSLFSFRNNVLSILKIIFLIVFFLYSIYPNSLTYAEGNPGDAKEPYLVGEQEPWMIVPKEDGVLIPSWMSSFTDGYDPSKAVLSKIPEANEQKIIEDFRKVTIHPMADKYKLRMPEEK